MKAVLLRDYVSYILYLSYFPDTLYKEHILTIKKKKHW